MIGKRVEKLVVIERLENSKVRCLCECGNERIVNVGHFNTGTIKSCGCHVDRHGHTSLHGCSREYISWANMRARCNKKQNKRYKDYGAIGIKVCERWNKFKNFLSDMGSCPDGFQIDRIDCYGNYEPENCRWVSPKENMRNRRNSKFYILNGKEFLGASEAAKYFGVSQATIIAWCEGRSTVTWLSKKKRTVTRHYQPKEGCSFRFVYGK